jgi:hypothetical protein
MDGLREKRRGIHHRSRSMSKHDGRRITKRDEVVEMVGIHGDTGHGIKRLGPRRHVQRLSLSTHRGYRLETLVKLGYFTIEITLVGCS